MTRQLRLAVRRGMLAVVLLALGIAVALPAEIDPAASRIGFILQTRWGQSLQGHFPDPRGEVAELADGRHQVRLKLKTATVEIADHPSYTHFTRGSGFFDADEYPQVEFLSDAYGPALLRDGGKLPGMLTIRNVRRREVFTISPGSCDTPGRECDVVASGTIHRGDYGMGRWNVALSDLVRFALRVRVRGPGR